MSVEYDEYQCYKGFLTAKSPTDGSTHVPFFVQVRDKDIIYDGSNIPWPLKNLYERSDSYTITKPAENIVFEYNGWNISATPNYRFRGTKAFNFDDLNFDFYRGDDTHLVGAFAVPFPIRADGACNIDITMQSSNSDMIQAVATSMFQEKEEDEGAGVSSFEVHLSNMISRFDTSFNETGAYGGTKLVMTIEGTIGNI